MAYQAVLESSQRLSPGITLHTFNIPSNFHGSIRPSGHVDFQFPPDLDLIYGDRGFSDTDRLLSFTPCCAQYDESHKSLRLFILTRNGRLTQLISAPRIQGPLVADFLGSAGGFTSSALQDSQRALCIASGTGVAPFISLGEVQGRTREAHLLCTLNGADFPAIEHLLEHNMLVSSNWGSVGIFITTGDDSSGLVAGKPMDWWERKIASMKSSCSGQKISFHCRRMSQIDIEGILNARQCSVLFCGSKTLEWQIKMWTLHKATVYTTD